MISILIIEKIWVTANKSGLSSAGLFWPGTEADFGGIRTNFAFNYKRDSGNHTSMQRADLMLAMQTSQPLILVTLG
jgi:hypothetical protein